MKRVNLKTCQGIETHLYLDGSLVRLSDLPEALKHLSAREQSEILDELLKHNHQVSSASEP